VTFEPVEVHLTLTNTGRRIVAEGRLETAGRFRCSRCLEEFRHPVSVPFSAEYQAAPSGGEPGQGGETEDADEVVWYHDDVIDTAEEIRQSVLLALPMKPLCAEDCPGLCPRCGHNLKAGPCGCTLDDVDPRLSALKDFKADLES